MSESAAVATPKVTSLVPPTKPAASQKKEAGPAAAAEPKAKKPRAPKEPKPPRESNFKKLYPDTATIHLLVSANPKRAGTASYDRFAQYKEGIKVSDALAAGVTYADISWDVGHGFIKVAHAA